MQIPKPKCWTAVVAALVLSITGCQSAKKPMAVAPAEPAPPTLTPKSAKVARTNKSTKAVKAESQRPTIQEQPKQQSQSDAIDNLVAAADKQYEAGQAQYSAGRTDAAKSDFDRAFDLLAGAPTGAGSDPRVQNEFDKIVDGVNSLELTGLKQADAVPEQQKSEPAPIDEANEVTFPVDPNIKAKAEAEVRKTHSDLPLMLNDTVASYINYYSTRGRDVLERALTRAGLYQDMISRVLKEEGVPQDLIYLAEAESGFRPLALSRAGARGMWQFISARARGYGLRRDAWVDERQDPEKSTRAAARHLKDLYNQFGDWYLAMAAYNSGPLTVQHAVRRTGYADFWQLYRRGVLPKETRNYVPIILAVTIMAKNPAQYGLDEIIPDKPLEVDRLTIDYPVDLRLVAQCVDSTLQNLQELNPSLLRTVSPKQGGYELHLPLGTADKYQAAIAAIPRDMRVWWRYHKVAPADTLSGIARNYRVTSKAILDVNHLQADELKAESKVIIPIAPGHRVPGEEVIYSRHGTRYRVRRGDTIASIASDFGVPAERIRRWNRLRGDRVRSGRLLVIHLPVSPGQEIAPSRAKSSKSKSASKIRTVSSSARVLHKVQRGETLYSIASTYNTTVEALRRDNHKVASNLRAGDVLVINQSR